MQQLLPEAEHEVRIFKEPKQDGHAIFSKQNTENWYIGCSQQMFEAWMGRAANICVLCMDRLHRTHTSQARGPFPPSLLVSFKARELAGCMPSTHTSWLSFWNNNFGCSQTEIDECVRKSVNILLTRTMTCKLFSYPCSCLCCDVFVMHYIACLSKLILKGSLNVPQVSLFCI